MIETLALSHHVGLSPLQAIQLKFIAFGLRIGSDVREVALAFKLQTFKTENDPNKCFITFLAFCFPSRLLLAFSFAAKCHCITFSAFKHFNIAVTR